MCKWKHIPPINLQCLVCHFNQQSISCHPPISHSILSYLLWNFSQWFIYYCSISYDTTDHKTLCLKCCINLEPCKTTYAIILNEQVTVIFLNTLSVIISADGKVSKNSYQNLSAYFAQIKYLMIHTEHVFVKLYLL